MYDVHRRIEIGWSLVSFIAFNIIMNVLFFAFEIFKQTKQKLKAKRANLRQSKSLAKMQKQL